MSLPGLIGTMVSYNECEDYIEQLNEYIKENMRFVKEFLQENLPNFKFDIPDATYLAWIDIRNVPFTSKEVQDAFVHVGKVAVMAGETYGMPKYLRLNCGCPKSKLEDGLLRMKKAMDALYSE